MQSYQLSYLISSDLSEEEIKNFQEKINSLIEKEGGILNRIEKPSKKKLAYPVKKRGLASLLALDFQVNPEGLANIERKLKEEDQILRYLLITKKLEVFPEISIKPKKEIEKLKKVELKEIEKKLEEILGE